MLGKRLATAVPLIGGFLAILAADLWLGPWYPCWLAISLAVLFLGGREIAGLLAATTVKPSTNAVQGGLLAMGFANWAPHLIPDPSPSGFDPSRPVDILAWPFLAFAAFVMASFIARSVQFSEPGKTMAALSGTVLAVAYVGLLGSFLIQLRWIAGPGAQGLVPLAALVAAAKGSDIGAYSIGRIAGRHKLWPQLSPNKTIEGALGGLLLGLAGSFLVFEAAGYSLGFRPFTRLEAVGFGLLVGPAGQLGDLMESMIKRDCEQKDASQAIPGFGGVLDVIDSLLFAAPVAYGYWLLLAH
jgi:phosphatidate cytidylyltransferase